MAALSRLRAILVEEDWMVGVMDVPIANMLREGPLPPIRWLARPDIRRYLADPFGMPGGSTVWCEEVRRHDGTGRLIEIDLSTGAERPIALGGGHVSYPYLFERGGTIFCLPEQSAQRRCVLYRVEAGGLVPHAEIARDRALADATFFFRGGLCWVAASDVELGAWDTLCLFFATDPAGPWFPHAGNPVKRDPASARPAGTPFVHRGQLYRPAQDCSRTYGGGVAINRIARLDPAGFAEEVVRVIGPPPGPYRHGIHTLSAWGGRTLVDAKRHVVNPVALRRKVARRLSCL